jgi:hypothetical protein
VSTLSKVAGQARPADGTLVIGDSQSLQAWRRQLRTVARADHLPAVMFALPALSHDQNQVLSALANEYRRACGCESGSLAASAAIAATIAAYFLVGGQLDAIGLRQVMALVGITALALIAGKLSGLIWARWRLLRIASELSGSTAR